MKIERDPWHRRRSDDAGRAGLNAGDAKVTMTVTDWAAQPNAMLDALASARASGLMSPSAWTLDGATVWQQSFTMHFSRYRDVPLLLRPWAQREPLHIVQLGWALTAWIVWRVIRGR